MTYLQGFMTLQKGHMGQWEAVYDLSGRGLWHFKRGNWGDRHMFMIYLEGFMVLQKGRTRR